MQGGRENREGKKKIAPSRGNLREMLSTVPEIDRGLEYIWPAGLQEQNTERSNSAIK